MSQDSTPSLQEIYLSACRNFDELTNKLLQGFNSAVDTALMGYSEQQAEALQRSAGTSESQHREVTVCLKDSLEAITQSVESTLAENERFLEHIEEELNINCRSLQQEIQDLAESLLRSHNISSKVLMAKLSGQCDKAIESVQQSSNKAKHGLRENSQSSSSLFGEGIVERQGRQYADLNAYENQARKEIPDMLAAMIARARLHEPKLAMQQKQHNDQIDSRIEQLKLRISEVSDIEMARILSTASDTESQLRATYEDRKAKLLATNEAYTRNFYSELEQDAAKSRSEVSELLSKLRADMLNTLDAAQSRGLSRSQENLDRAKQLSEELQNLIEDQRLIAAQKSTVIAQIIEEIREVESNFESKLLRMSQAQLEKLSKTCEASMSEISSSKKAVEGKIQNLADMYLQQIEEEEERILKIIERRLDKALGFINQATGEGK